MISGSYSWSANASYSDEEGIAHLEIHLTEEVKDLIHNNVRINSGLLLEVNKTNGVLMGYRLKSILRGKIVGYKIICEAETYLKIDGYDLPEFKLFQELQFVSGAGGVVILVGIMTSIILKRKIKRTQ